MEVNFIAYFTETLFIVNYIFIAYFVVVTDYQPNLSLKYIITDFRDN